MENCKIVIQKRWQQSLKGGAGYTLYPSACLREKRPVKTSELWNNKRQEKDTNLERKMYQSPRGFNRKSKVYHFSIFQLYLYAQAYVRILIVGSCCYYLSVMKFRLLKFIQTRQTVFPDGKKARLRKKGSKVLFKNDQSEGLETLTSCKVVKQAWLQPTLRV